MKKEQSRKVAKKKLERNELLKFFKIPSWKVYHILHSDKYQLHFGNTKLR